MQDLLNHNTLNITGTPTLVAGALTVDPDQALAFSGPTSYASALDSASLSITGSLSIELFLRLPSLPGSTLDVLRKTGSYSVQVNTSGNVLFNVVNGASSVTVTSNATLSTSTWYHLVCVYDNEYAGAQSFGKTTVGSTTTQVDDGDDNNKAVTRFTLVEPALLQAVNLSLQYTDELWPVQMCAVVYANNAGLPDALVTRSGVQTLSSPTPQWRSATWVNFPLTPAVVPAGTYHLGYVADTIFGGGGAKPVLAIGREATGGLTSRRNDSVSGPSDPFGVVTSSNTDVLAAYCDYTATSRTGNEGKALIYVNGARNISASYSAGIADTANPLEVCPAMAAQVDEISIWNKPLSSVQVATHYTAH